MTGDICKRIALVAVVAVALGCVVLVPSSGAKKNKVTVSGKAYAFNHMDTFIEGATIRVRELPKKSATTDANGDYKLKLPDNRTVTLYIDPPEGFHEIDLQTIQTRGTDLKNVNFQAPADFEYNALAAILGVEIGPDGRPVNCAIVTTASARNVRDVSYEKFEERTPHGVEGATAKAVGKGSGKLPDATYFNEFVIPDPAQPSTSEDGGIIWTEVPEGTYRIQTKAPGHRFASFLATCKPGRIVNANPPRGAYELVKKEKTLPSDAAIATIGKVKAKRSGVSFEFVNAEELEVKAKLTEGKKTVGRFSDTFRGDGGAVSFAYKAKARGKKAKLEITLVDPAGDKARSKYPLKLPK